MLTLVTVLSALAAVALVVWLGFQIPFPTFTPPAGVASTPGTVAIPTDLPGPVVRYLRAVAGDRPFLPRADSFAYWGHGTARPFGVWLPLRHRATIVPGSLMLREMDFPWYRVTLLHVVDAYRDGAGSTVIAGLLNQETRGPHTDQGAFLALAAESVMVPSADALGGRWEPVDDHSARLVVPFEGSEEQLLVAFDPATGLPARITAQRFQREDGPKIGWHIDLSRYREMAGLHVPTHFEVVWEDVGRPWSTWDVEGLALNVGVPSQEPEARTAPQRAPEIVAGF